MPTRCCYYDTTDLKDAALFEYGISIIPWQARIQKTLRYYFDRDKRLCLGAGLLLHHMLLENGITDMVVDVDENGKPYLLNNSKIHFNISHDGDIAAVALSDHAVGVDVCSDRVYDKEVAAFSFSGEEIECVMNSSEPDLEYTRIWAKKESYLKMTGTGLLEDPKNVTVTGMDNLTEHRIPGYLIVVCTSEPDGISFEEWRLKKV